MGTCAPICSPPRQAVNQGPATSRQSTRWGTPGFDHRQFGFLRITRPEADIAIHATFENSNGYSVADGFSRDDAMAAYRPPGESAMMIGWSMSVIPSVPPLVVVRKG